MLHLVLLAALLIPVAGTPLFANGNPYEKPLEVNEALKSKIVKLIDRPDMSALNGHRFHADLEFMITPQNEIVVMAVYTNELFFVDYLKQQLNYMPVHLKGVRKLTMYKLSVTFVKP